MRKDLIHMHGLGRLQGGVEAEDVSEDDVLLLLLLLLLCLMVMVHSSFILYN